jgi:hypothetical protein
MIRHIGSNLQERPSEHLLSMEPNLKYQLQPDLASFASQIVSEFRCENLFNLGRYFTSGFDDFVGVRADLIEIKNLQSASKGESCSAALSDWTPSQHSTSLHSSSTRFTSASSIHPGSPVIRSWSKSTVGCSLINAVVFAFYKKSIFFLLK